MTSKQQYLDFIRSHSAYPVYRGVIGLIALLLYALAVVIGLGALIGGLGMMIKSFWAG